ncbi:MAG: histidinol dehydrogenase, partial [Arenimonas sp.]
MSAALAPRVRWSTLDEVGRAALLRRPSRLVAAETTAGVRAILAQVQAGGDEALRELGLRFDDVDLGILEVRAQEFDEAIEAAAPALVAAIEDAASRIEAWHRAGASAPCALDTAQGVRCERVLRPIRRVGLYVPAGSAPLPSTVLMLGIPARLAGCPEVVLCTPPRPDGRVDPSVLLAARACGISRVFKLGGAQAIAAMALGTATVPRCDKLFGPGN